MYKKSYNKNTKTYKRAERVIKSLSEKGKKNVKKPKSIRQAQIDAGYSKSYADTGRALKSRTAQELIAEHLSDEIIYQTHGDLLRSSEISHLVFPKIGRGKKKRQLTNAEIKKIVQSVPGCRLIYIKPDDYIGKVAFFQAPDAKSRRDALDMAYKVKGAYAPDKIELTKRKYQDLSNAELAALEKKLKDFLLKRD